MSVAPPEQLAEVTQRLADTGVAVTVLPATDLFLMGRDQDCGVRRGVLDAHRLSPHGVTCTLSSNNILNPFTPFGDGSLIRMANMYANIAQASKPAEIRHCFEMASTQSAKLLRQDDFGNCRRLGGFRAPYTGTVSPASAGSEGYVARLTLRDCRDRGESHCRDLPRAATKPLKRSRDRDGVVLDGIFLGRDG